MQRNWKTWLALGASVVALGSLGGCWFDSNDDDDVAETPADSTSVPASAGASTSAFISYLNALPPSDTTEPLSIDNFTPPTDDTGEPSPLT